MHNISRHTCRAIRDSSVGDEGNSYSSAIAATSAANPAAELARPAAVGKLFSEKMCRFSEEIFGSEESEVSKAARRALSSRKQACVRAPDTSWDEPFRRSESSAKDAEQEAVVRVRRSSWERVTDMEELVGRLSLVSLFPLYAES
jgi:hypothetical protein